MWKNLYEVFTNVITLTYRMEKLEKTVSDQGREMVELWDAVTDLRVEQQRAAEREAYERKMLALMLENQLLKSGRQLPPASDAGDRK